MVRAREDKQTKTGDPFVVLQLGNASGTISANIWKEQVAAMAGIKAGMVVQVIGTVEFYLGRRQIKLSTPPRVVPSAAINLDDFLPRIRQSTESLWSQVDAWRGEMSSTALRRAVASAGPDESIEVTDAAPW